MVAPSVCWRRSSVHRALDAVAVDDVTRNLPARPIGHTQNSNAFASRRPLRRGGRPASIPTMRPAIISTPVARRVLAGLARRGVSRVLRSSLALHASEIACRSMQCRSIRIRDFA